MVMIFKKYGIKEDEVTDKITYFLKEIYLRCQEFNLSVQKVFMYIQDVIQFSNEISLSQIPQYLKEKKIEKEELEYSFHDLNQKVIELKKLEKYKKEEIKIIKNFK